MAISADGSHVVSGTTANVKGAGLRAFERACGFYYQRCSECRLSACGQLRQRGSCAPLLPEQDFVRVLVGSSSKLNALTMSDDGSCVVPGSDKRILRV